MQSNFENQHQSEIEEDNSGLFLRLLYRYLLNHWKWFTISILFALPMAYFYTYYSIPEYQVSSTILIKDPENKWKDKSKISELDIFDETKNIDNEIGILKSISINKQVIYKANLFYDIFNHGKYRVKEIYNKVPFAVLIDTARLQSIYTNFYIDILSENNYRLYTDEITAVDTYDYANYTKGGKTTLPKIDKEVSFGETVLSAGFSFKIVLNENFAKTHIGKTYHFFFHDINNLAKSYSNKTQIERITKDATILRLYMRHPLPEKGIKYLNTLSKEYVELGLTEKNETASRTISFIDNMLSEVTDSMYIIENNLQVFRTEKQVMDLSFEAQSLFSELNQLEKEKSIEEIKLRYYNYLEKSISSNDSLDKIIAPSTIGVNDVLLNTLINELTTLQNEKTKLLISSTEENPYYKVLTTKINNTKKAISENVNNIVNSTILKINNIEKEIQKFNSEIAKLPKTERELLNIQRNFSINEQIYTYLLERRAEAAIAKASNIPDNKIVDYANLDQKTFPNIRKVYISAILLALIIPGLFLSLKYIFKNKISTRDDVISRTDIPIAGLLSHSKFENTEIVSTYSKSLITETFRSLKTNLNFLKKDKSKQCFLVTSTISGEGKSFVSINLASMYALSKQKVLLINADLRKPSIEKNLKIENNKKLGLSNVLSGNCSWEESILHYEKNKNCFDVLTAGPIPPNPGEMLDSNKMGELMGVLKKQYDIIIIDSPPVGIIADSLNIIRYCDRVLYVFKHNYSYKNSIRLLNEIVKTTEQDDTFAIIINDVNSQYSINYSSYGAYSYSYGKYKNHGYYGKYVDEDKVKEGFFKRINQFLSTK